MEKFTVDLDAVLDEFEFNEGQANQSNGGVCPTVSGFFSPVDEVGPSSLDLMSVGGTPAGTTRFSPERIIKDLENRNQADIRYDIPFLLDKPQSRDPIADNPGDSENPIPSQPCTTTPVQEFHGRYCERASGTPSGHEQRAFLSA